MHLSGRRWLLATGMPGLAADLTDGAEAVHNYGLGRSWERKIVPTSTGKKCGTGQHHNN